MEDISIQSATPDEIPTIVDFVIKARVDMFPFLDQASNHQLARKELASFQKNYLEGPHGAFLTARSNGRLVATIGYLAYDYRFPHIDLETHHVVEVVRLYVDPEWRRVGLASKLFAALEVSARQAGINQLYLHTHPFLPNAIGFWKRQGFSIITVDDDPLWQTTHMSRPLEE
ncbi:hypothetical protein FSARC_1063 [Fusarium sarcochroum]|uniref:N-acetyltransferase domain-containing protein n=1 Tax=Fusarium sarcochroum TaxID=1208366 RepID=A0A8H4U9S8_9HYPO|nr:hypothetical protein FSARC_1063 [Fusarium sarcochroum]